MPNWCENEVEITFESKAEYDKFITQAGVEENTSPYLDYDNEKNGYGFFDRFVPTPSEMLIGEGWWWWRIDNWGTKWNPEFHMFETDDDALKITLGMSTAWSSPKEFFTTFTTLFPSAKVQLNYLEEGMGFCGRAYLSEGTCNEAYINDIPTEMYVKAGATLNSEGNIDWDEEQSYCLWEIINDEDQFNEFI